MVGEFTLYGVRCNKHLSKLTTLIMSAGHVTNADGGLHGIGKILPLEPEGHIDQADQHGVAKTVQ